MNLSVKESKRLENFISSVLKRLNDEQNNESHSAASTRIVDFSDPLRSPIPGSAAASVTIRESTSSR